ncbi:MAG: hypothetical protein IIC84_01145 [Chloroflexi bacterium]|nr:hypothetical protein [Chloroflexota bacterium]
MTKQELIEDVSLLRMRVGELETVTLQWEQAERALKEKTVELERLTDELVVETQERQLFEQALMEHSRELDESNRALREALDNVKTLRGLLPICASCKSIRDDMGYWNRLESYIEEHTEAEFTHTLCIKCVRNMYPDVYAKLPDKEKEKYAQNLRR